MTRLSSGFFRWVRAGIRAQARSIPLLFVFSAVSSFAQIVSVPAHAYFINCSAAEPGNGSRVHPWNSLAAAQANTFKPGDRIALARGTVCRGSFAPRGSGMEARPIRLTAYGRGPRPRIIANSADRQVLSLFNQKGWQIDSLDLSGADHYGIFISGDKGILRHIYLENLSVHDIYGGPVKNKDNGLVVVGPSGHNVVFEDVLVDGVDAAHTNQWAGILIGGGNFGMDMPLNRHVIVRNASVHDVYGDGIVLFRDSDSWIENSAAWETGMQPTETIGTPNAIWTWTCTRCTVRDNEAFLTDSPGVDGGAYDIDWNNTGNIVERNYAHDTQGYCIAVFAAGYVTSDSIVRDNLCVDNARSPRLAALQGAIYLHTWNDGVIRGLRIERNTLIWNPPVASAKAIVNDAKTGSEPIEFTDNTLESAASGFYRADAEFAPSGNHYTYFGDGDAFFTLGGRRKSTLAALQAAGFEKGSTLVHETAPEPTEIALHLDATVSFTLEADGLLAPGTRAQLMVLRNLADQYGDGSLKVVVHLFTQRGRPPEDPVAQANALIDLDAAGIRFVDDGREPGSIRLSTVDGRVVKSWRGFQNAATLGGAVRALIGPPRFAMMNDSLRAEKR